MEYPNTSKRMSNVFRGLVLSLALILVACGGDSGDPTPTAPSGEGESAAPTVPTDASTPESNVNEGDITVLEPQFPATSEASTPDSDTDAGTPEAENDGEIDSSAVESTPDSGPVDLTGDDEDVSLAATPDDEDVLVAATPDETIVEVVAEGTPVDEESEDTTESTPPADADAAPTARVATGNETFNHPGDGTGGSGMPGESSSNDSGDEEQEVSATPSASPIAQLTIEGCDVPDVPGFLGDNPTRVLTADINFRSGPGVSCDPVTEEGLGEGQTVVIIGGPVTQAEDDSEWVQIEVNGELGWVSTEFLEEVDPE